MKMLRLGMLAYVSVLLSGCLYGQCMDGPCALERERIIKSIKAYGEFFVKPGMTKEGWRQDWVACGGMGNGAYANDAPPGSTSAVMGAASNKKARQLDTCMQSKGYEFRRDLKQ